MKLQPNGLIAKISMYSVLLIPITALALLIKTLVFGIKVKVVKPKVIESK